MSGCHFILLWLIYLRKIPYYTAAEIKLIGILRREYKNATVEDRKLLFQDAYNLWFNRLYLPDELSHDGRKVCRCDILILWKFICH